jgi:hypothetical protein
MVTTRLDSVVRTRAELTARAAKTAAPETFTFASNDNAETEQFDAMPLVSLLWRLHTERKGRA